MFIGGLTDRNFSINAPTGNTIPIDSIYADVGNITLFPKSGGSYTFIANETIIVPGTFDIFRNTQSLLQEKAFETQKTITISYDDYIDISVLATTVLELAACFSAHRGVTVAEIMQLDCTSYRVEDVSALTYLRNLRELSLDASHILDIQPLSELANLRIVDVAASTGNCASQFDLYELFKDTEVITALNESLCILDNRLRIVDIRFNDPGLDSCWRDNELNVEYAHQVKQLSCYRRSSLSVNNIDDIDQLIGLRALKLILDDSSVLDISPLESLENLGELVVKNGILENVTRLGQLKLNALVLDNNISQADFSSLMASIAEPYRLQSIDVTDNSLTDLSALSRLTNIEQITVAENRIIDLSPLANMKKVTHLDVSNNQIQTVPDLLLPQLLVFDLNDNPVSAFAQQRLSTSLSRLLIENGQLVDLVEVGQLPTQALRELVLTNNGITDILPLEPLLLNNSTLDLMLNNNLISDVGVFNQSSENSIQFNFEYNQITTGVEKIGKTFRRSSFLYDGNNQIPCRELASLGFQLSTRSDECIE